MMGPAPQGSLAAKLHDLVGGTLGARAAQALLGHARLETTRDYRSAAKLGRAVEQVADLAFEGRTAPYFGDGFESGLASWTVKTGGDGAVAVGTDTVRNGSHALISASLPLNTWTRLTLHLKVGPAGAGVIDVYKDGIKAFATTTATLGINPIATVELGNDTTRRRSRASPTTSPSRLAPRSVAPRPLSPASVAAAGELAGQPKANRVGWCVSMGRAG